MDKYECTVCGYTYDPADGDEASDIRTRNSFSSFAG